MIGAGVLGDLPVGRVQPNTMGHRKPYLKYRRLQLEKILRKAEARR